MWRAGVRLAAGPIVSDPLPGFDPEPDEMAEVFTFCIDGTGVSSAVLLSCCSAPS